MVGGTSPEDAGRALTPTRALGAAAREGHVVRRLRAPNRRVVVRAECSVESRRGRIRLTRIRPDPDLDPTRPDR
ncbi:hypothetical protein NL676_025313 [Syzygium grande]|nr:hypothetical protein NL676_025313 [Syzygium grande]